jgi:hypothetical protein
VAWFLLLLGHMTQPRLVVPGTTVMVTRRILGRHYLFGEVATRPAVFRAILGLREAPCVPLSVQRPPRLG